MNVGRCEDVRETCFHDDHKHLYNLQFIVCWQRQQVQRDKARRLVMQASEHVRWCASCLASF